MCRQILHESTNTLQAPTVEMPQEAIPVIRAYLLDWGMFHFRVVFEGSASMEGFPFEGLELRVYRCSSDSFLVELLPCVIAVVLDPCFARGLTCDCSGTGT